MSNQWLDPSGFKTQDEFVKAYNEVYGRAKAYEEIINLLADSQGKIETLTKGISGEKKSYAL